MFQTVTELKRGNTGVRTTLRLCHLLPPSLCVNGDSLLSSRGKTLGPEPNPCEQGKHVGFLSTPCYACCKPHPGQNRRQAWGFRRPSAQPMGLGAPLGTVKTRGLLLPGDSMWKV